MTDPAMTNTDRPDTDRPVDDPYSRVSYRRLIRWERRIAREAPFLREVLAAAPDRSVVDLGCGTGEHVAFFAQDGARAVGLDRSEDMIEAARDHERVGHGCFVLGEARDAASLLRDEAPFGLAICLGNMLPHLCEDADLAAFLTAAHDVLAPGGRLLVQLLNYEKLLATGASHLPMNVRPGDDGHEIVFIRLVRGTPGGRVLFFPATLDLDPDSDEPLTVSTTRRVELRAWTRTELSPALEEAGFDARVHGDVHGGAFVADTSPDLVVVATRRA